MDRGAQGIRAALIRGWCREKGYGQTMQTEDSARGLLPEQRRGSGTGQPRVPAHGAGLETEAKKQGRLYRLECCLSIELRSRQETRPQTLTPGQGAHAHHHAVAQSCCGSWGAGWDPHLRHPTRGPRKFSHQPSGAVVPAPLTEARTKLGTV